MLDPLLEPLLLDPLLEPLLLDPLLEPLPVPSLPASVPVFAGDDEDEHAAAPPATMVPARRIAPSPCM